MARFRDEGFVAAAFTPHLQPGEQVQHVAFGVKQPNIGLIILLIALAVLPGIIAVALLTKEYVVALTGQRFIALEFSGSKIKVKQVIEFYPQELTPGSLKTSKGSLFTHIAIRLPQKQFIAKFHRMGMPNNKPQAEAIVDALSSTQPQARAA